MEIIRGLTNLRERHRGCVVTIGNFDGVHRGHQAILQQVRDKADALGAPSMLICFEPQPKEYFDVFNAPARLTRFREKVTLLDEHGVDYVLCFKFDEKTRSIKADEFVDILVNRIGVRALFVGDDFRFGNDRSGDFDLLRARSETHGFELTNLYTMTYEHIRVSSSRIREALAAGDFDAAEAMLGHPYSIMGKVIYGRQLGRQLGAPTANVQLHRYRAPIDGVYAVEIEGLDQQYYGVANVGVRPTLEEDTPTPILEVNLFDFSRNIYGRTVKTVFRHKVRDEKKFDGLDELKEAIAESVRQARAWFGARDAARDAAREP